MLPLRIINAIEVSYVGVSTIRTAAAVLTIDEALK